MPNEVIDLVSRNVTLIAILIDVGEANFGVSGVRHDDGDRWMEDLGGGCDVSVRLSLISGLDLSVSGDCLYDSVVVAQDCFVRSLVLDLLWGMLFGRVCFVQSLLSIAAFFHWGYHLYHCRGVEGMGSTLNVIHSDANHRSIGTDHC